MEHIYDSLSNFKGLEEHQSTVDIDEAIKIEILEYEDNPIMTSVLNKQTTFEDTLKELKKVGGGWKIYFPRLFKNKKHNDKVEKLEELIPRVSVLKTSGIFKPDNGVIMGMYGFVLGYFGSIGYQMILNLEKNTLDYLVMGASVATIGAVMGIFYSSDRELYPKTIENAKYLDFKIQELV